MTSDLPVARASTGPGTIQGWGTVLADPPWPSASHKGKRDSWIKTNMRPRYSTMSPRQILDLPVGSVASNNAILVMWTTWMHLPLAMQVIEAWGFKYATGMPWLKVVKPAPDAMFIGGKGCPARQIPAPIYGPGVWFQHCTELVLIARRGRPFGALGNPRPARKGIIIAPRQEHSRKPEELHQWIESSGFPTPRLELFARRPRPGWTVWGDEA